MDEEEVLLNLKKVREKNAENQRNYRAKNLEKLKQQARDRTDYRIANNLCTRCGKPKEKDYLKSWCPDCTEKHSKWLSTKK